MQRRRRVHKRQPAARLTVGPLVRGSIPPFGIVKAGFIIKRSLSQAEAWITGVAAEIAINISAQNGLQQQGSCCQTASAHPSVCWPSTSVNMRSRTDSAATMALLVTCLTITAFLHTGEQINILNVNLQSETTKGQKRSLILLDGAAGCKRRRRYVLVAVLCFFVFFKRLTLL